MDNSRLTYFEMRGRAEAIRILLYAKEEAFEDRRIISGAEWEEIRPKLPFGGLPIFETGGVLVCESHAILRYIGKTLTAVPRDALDIAELDVAHDAIAESQEDLWRFNWIESYYDHIETYAKEKLQLRLERLENWFCLKRDRASDWFGAEFSHVDCIAFCYLDEIDAFFPGVLAEFAALSALRYRIASLPSVSDYLTSAARPVVFGIGSMGPKVDPRVPLPLDYEFCNPWTQPIDLAPILRGQRRLTSGCR